MRCYIRLRLSPQARYTGQRGVNCLFCKRAFGDASLKINPGSLTLFCVIMCLQGNQGAYCILVMITVNKEFLYLREFCINAPLRRFMQWDSFLQILTGTFYVSYREEFSDEWEKGIPNKLSFKAIPVGTHASTDEYERYSEMCKEVDAFNKVPASCWTTNHAKNNLMWESYSPMGVCIESTPEDIMLSLDTTEFDIIASRIRYKYSLVSYEECIFSKSPAYKNEREFRFYFKPKDNYMKDGCKKGITLNVCPETMIHRVYFSPFIRKEAAVLQKALIENSFDYMRDKISIIEL